MTISIQASLILSVQFLPGDLDNLVLCNRVGMGRNRSLFFCLKNSILQNYAIFDGYDLQTWDDIDYYDDEEVFATHYHILKRYIIGDHCFHQPINEFQYCVWNQGPYGDKKSKNFKYFLEMCKNRIVGQKKYISTEYERKLSFWAFKQLVRKFSFFLKEGVK